MAILSVLSPVILAMRLHSPGDKAYLFVPQENVATCEQSIKDGAGNLLLRDGSICLETGFPEKTDVKVPPFYLITHLKGQPSHDAIPMNDEGHCQAGIQKMKQYALIAGGTLGFGYGFNGATCLPTGSPPA